VRLPFIGLLAVCLYASTAAALTIRGDRHWVEHPQCPDGWRLLDFDDSSWQPVPYPWTRMWPREWPLDPEARPIWGTNLFPINCLRRSFQLDALPDDPAVANIWVDDDYDLFVNGVPVGASRDHMAEMPGEAYDVTPLLRLGRNVVALQVRDNGGSTAALVSLEIPGIPDPPVSLEDRFRAIEPWLEFVLYALAAAVWIASVRRCAQMGRRAGAGPTFTLAATIALAVLIQLVFAWAPFYQSHREMPLADWWRPPMLAIILLVPALAFVRGRSVALVRTEPPVRREVWWLTAIVLLAACLRIYRLDTVPPGFFQDEATNGNDALALLRLGYPAIWSDSVGGRPTLFLYLLSGALHLFGVGYLTLKIVPVALGIGGVIAVYAVGKAALGSRAALWAAFLLAVSRWDIHYSRMAWEAICVPLFSAAGFALLLRGLRDRRRAWLALIAAAVVLTAGVYTYAAYRAVPAAALVFLLATLFSADRPLLARRWIGLAVAGAVAVAIAAPLALFAWQQPDLYWYRYAEVSLTSYMSYYGTPMPWVHQLGKGLLSLTAVGDEIIRHNLPWAPHLDRLTGALMIIGMATAAAIRPHLGFRLLWCWFITFMIFATLTMDGPHATRLLGVAPAAVLFAGFGIAQLVQEIGALWRPRPATIIAAAAALAIASLNAYEYFVLEANHPAADFEYDATARSLCEEVRRQPVVVDLHWTPDVAYWSDGQCQFLARGKYTVGKTVELADVLAGNPYESERHKPALIAIGQEFIDLHRASLAFDADGVPQLALPREPQIARDRSGHILYYLYGIALPEPRSAG
jgi:4-amino-4-deoxy-L-arabinose transferase-like glycosyltransferase